MPQHPLLLKRTALKWNILLRVCSLIGFNSTYCFSSGRWRQLHWSAGVLHGRSALHASGGDGAQSQSGGRSERPGRRNADVLPLQTEPPSRTVLRAWSFQIGIKKNIPDRTGIIEIYRNALWSSPSAGMFFCFLLMMKVLVKLYMNHTKMQEHEEAFN